MKTRESLLWGSHVLLPLLLMSGCQAPEPNESDLSEGTKATIREGAYGLPRSAQVAFRAVGGAPGTRDRRLDLSAAHNLVRYFSVDSPFSVCDATLARAVSNDHSLTRAGLAAALARYDGELPDVDVLRSGPTTLRPAHVKVEGPLAIIEPGTGSITLPDGVEVVAVDLRNLPAISELDEVLARMVAPALAHPVRPLFRSARANAGAVDEIFSPFNVYSTSVFSNRQTPIPAGGARDLPIVLIVGQRIAPQAAAFAATLRAAQRAWIVGKSVPVTVAETEWQGIDDRGLAVRTSMLANYAEQPTTLPNQTTIQDDPNE